MVVCSRALGGSRQRFLRGSSVIFVWKFFKVPFHFEVLGGNNFQPCSEITSAVRQHSHLFKNWNIVALCC